MGWKDLFKSKGTKAKPDPRLRWFGKLPTYADYYCSQTDEDWTVEFNDWMLKGCELYLTRQRESRGETRVPTAACVIRLPKSQMTVLGAIRDYGGDMRGRPFPLAFYVGLPSELWPGPTSSGASAALRVLQELGRLREQVTRFFNAPGRFDDAFGGRQLDLTGLDAETSDSSWLQAARTMPLADWFAAARPCPEIDDVNTWFQRMSAWGDNIAKLESEEFEPTLRFPLAPSLPCDVQVAGWLRWLEQRMDLEHRHLSLMLLQDAGGSVTRFSVVAREVAPEDFLLATSLAGTLPYVDDLCTLAPGADVQKQADNTDGSTSPIVRAPERWADFVDSEGVA